MFGIRWAHAAVHSVTCFGKSLASLFIVEHVCVVFDIVGNSGRVKVNKIAGYYHLEDDITNAGATYTDLPAVVDSKIVTTAHYKDMGPWMHATLDFFNEKKK